MNNKIPDFVEPFSVSINETIGADEEIITVQAKDKDIGDYVT